MINVIRNVKNYHLYRPSHFKKVWTDSFSGYISAVDILDNLDNTFIWIDESFKATKDGGSSAYYSLSSGWKASYPETTGYLIPTMYNYAKYRNNQYWTKLACKAADWLVSIQQPEGGWQGLQVDVECEPRVFNTAMILKGLIAAYQETGDNKYLQSAINGMRWVLSKIDSNGLFLENNPVPGGNSADTLALACTLMVIQYVSGDEQRDATDVVKKSLDAHIVLQQPNGWFDKCSFSDTYQGTALLHHLGYTLDGLILSSEYLADEKYFKIALVSAERLLQKFETEKSLPAFINKDWSTYYDICKNKNSLCLTGLSQVAIVFERIYHKTNNTRYRAASEGIIKLVAAICNRNSREKGLAYGVAGSYPVYGNYQKYKIVNWAAKYHADSVLMNLNNSASLLNRGN